MNGVSDAFREVADVLETVETNRTNETEVHISSVTPLSQDILTSNTISAELGIQIPLFDSGIHDTRLQLTAEDVQLIEDGSLLVEFLIAVSPDERKTRNCSVSEPQSETGDSSESGLDEFEQPDSDPTESKSDTSPSEPTTDARAEIPAYRRPERLREVYEAHDTFGEMTDALGVDVTPQTVRRYMIKYDIHEPASNTGSQTAETLLNAEPVSVSESSNGQTSEGTESTDGPVPQSENRRNSGTPPVSTDGHGGSSDEERGPEFRTVQSSELKATATGDEGKDSRGDTGKTSLRVAETDRKPGEQTTPPKAANEETGKPEDDVTETDLTDEIEVNLPDHLTLDDVKSTAQNAKTLYEAQRQLELDREEARQLLQQLNLLDLVHGRATTRDLTDRTIENINRRLQSSVDLDSERA